MGQLLSFGSRSTAQAPNQPAVAANNIAVAKDTIENSKAISNRACFGAGCYWGTQKYFEYDFSGKRSISKGQVGFMGPVNAVVNPSYEDVCTGATGHVEVYEYEFDSGDMDATYEEMVRFFFQFHDPTTPNRQGNDKGTQYASVIFAYDDKQFDIAKKVRSELQKHIDNGLITAFTEKRVTTDIRVATTFFPATSKHQDYLARNPKGYCNHRVRFEKWPL